MTTQAGVTAASNFRMALAHADDTLADAAPTPTAMHRIAAAIADAVPRCDTASLGHVPSAGGPNAVPIIRVPHDAFELLDSRSHLDSVGLAHLKRRWARLAHPDLTRDTDASDRTAWMQCINAWFAAIERRRRAP